MKIIVNGNWGLFRRIHLFNKKNGCQLQYDWVSETKLFLCSIFLLVYKPLVYLKIRNFLVCSHTFLLLDLMYFNKYKIIINSEKNFQWIYLFVNIDCCPVVISFFSFFSLLRKLLLWLLYQETINTIGVVICYKSDVSLDIAFCTDSIICFDLLRIQA